MGVGSYSLIRPAAVVADHNADCFFERADIEGTHAERACQSRTGYGPFRKT